MPIKYFIFSLFISGSLAAQSPPVLNWQTTEFAENMYLKTPKVKPDGLGNTFMLTNQTNTSPLGGLRLVKYDSLGNVLWKQNSQPGIIGIFAGNFTVDSLGNSYIGFNYDGGLPDYDADARLVKYSPDGNKIWEVNYGLEHTGDSYLLFSELDTATGALITLGINRHETVDSENFLFIQAINPLNGSIIWATSIPGVFNPLNLRMQSSNIQVLASQYLPGSQYYLNILFDFTGSIQEQYRKPFSGYTPDFNYISKTGDVIFGNRGLKYAVTRIDIQGDTLWRYEDSGSSSNNWVRGIIEDDSLNTYATGCTRNDSVEGMSTTVKIGSNGDVKWINKSQLVDNQFSTGNSLAIYKNTVIVVGGANITQDSQKLTILSYNKSSGIEIYKIIIAEKKITFGEDLSVFHNKLYFSGVTHENSVNTTSALLGLMTLDEASSTANIGNVKFPIAVFPNPTTDIIRVSNIEKGLFSTIQLLDEKGTVLKSESISSSEHVISLSWLPAGAYIILLQGSKLQVSKKIVKL